MSVNTEKAQEEDCACDKGPCLGHFPRVELTGLGGALGESGAVWGVCEGLGRYRTLYI